MGGSTRRLGEQKKPPRPKTWRAKSGAEGNRTHTPSRAPVFETGAIPIMPRLQGGARVFHTQSGALENSDRRARI